MKVILPLIILLSSAFVHASNSAPKGKKSKGDTVLVREKKPLFKRKREETPPPLIEKMSDQQLMNLIDHMFEAAYMPPDLWGEVMMETAKRNLTKANRKEYDMLCAQESGKLHIQPLTPDSMAPPPLPDGMRMLPAADYYSDSDEDISILFKDQFAQDTTYTLTLETAEYGCFSMPAWGPLSSEYGWRHNKWHKGTDIQLRKGDTVTCAFDGVVRFAQKKGGYGNMVIVRHYNGLETVYGHLSKIKAKEGDVIAAGDLIGLAGSTGHSTGPHLHFEIRFMGVPVNPQYFISYDYGNLMYNTIVFKKNKNGLLAAFSPETESHTVEKGETITDIAIHYGITAKQLRELNGFTPKQYFRMKAGMAIKVREIQRDDSASK